MYQSQSISSLANIMAHVATFAGAQGWTVDNSVPTAPKFTHPTLPGAVQFTLLESSGLTFEPSAGGAVPSATIAEPIYNPSSPAPTTLHMFIDLAPAPYIALVVEFGFNVYRHLYFGYMEKLGAYTGGEVLGAATPSGEGDPILFKDFTHVSNQFLFRGRCNRWGTGQQGGVHVIHADNPNPWREFFATGLIVELDDLDDTQAFGGFKDDMNDGLLWNAESPFAGSNILVPCNLYAVRNPGPTAAFVPLGRPAGVRMVNMQDLDPGTVINVAGDDWRVFPAYSKRNARKPGIPISGSNPTNETSLWVGYAYPE
jgi:hypothetical protein